MGVSWWMCKDKSGRQGECLAAVHTAFAAVGAAFASFFGDETAAECCQTGLFLSWELACWQRREREREITWLTHQAAKQPWLPFFFSLTTTCCGGPCWYCICSFSTSKRQPGFSQVQPPLFHLLATVSNTIALWTMLLRSENWFGTKGTARGTAVKNERRGGNGPYK